MFNPIRPLPPQGHGSHGPRARVPFFHCSFSQLSGEGYDCIQSLSQVFFWLNLIGNQTCSLPFFVFIHALRSVYTSHACAELSWRYYWVRRDLYLVYIIPTASNGPEFPFLVLDLLSIILTSYPKAHHQTWVWPG